MNINVNGTSLHYETAGNGPPIVLLHGNGEDMRIFDALTDRLKNDYTVYRMDTRGHGSSKKVNSYHYEDMVNDVKEFIDALSIEKPILYGFSDGGIVGLMFASEHPGILSGLAVSGANLHPKDMKLRFRFPMLLRNSFRKDPLLELMLKEPNITENDLKKIDVPVLFTIGSRDIITKSQAEHIVESIPDAELAVIDGADHSDYVVGSDKLFPVLLPFMKNAIEKNSAGEGI